MAAPRLPISEDYWINRGKFGKKVMLYTHDDLDGIASAVAVKKYLLKNNFDIVGYGILNYQDGWKYTTIDKEYINIVVDYSTMPEKDREHLIDYYVDHHGLYSEKEKEYFKSMPIIKMKTDSAYEAVCLQLGERTDSILLDSIDMIDSAKYTEYGVDWRDIIKFSLPNFKNLIRDKGIKIAKLTFAGAFNQFIKRGDHTTLIDVIHNLEDVSIYQIYLMFKKLYPYNNIMNKKSFSGPKEFLSDGAWRINTMYMRTIGSKHKKEHFFRQTDFLFSYYDRAKEAVNNDGYQLFGKLVYTPPGTWANALRVRSIILHELDAKNIMPYPYNFILLQYGNTLQVCSFDKMDKIEEKPKYRNGEDIDNISTYMARILSNMRTHFGYDKNDTAAGGDDITISGGHTGIGTISNIYGHVKYDPAYPITKKFEGTKYLDIFKNKIIADLSGIEWGNVKLRWAEEYDRNSEFPNIDYKKILVDRVKVLNNIGEVYDPVTGFTSTDVYEHYAKTMMITKVEESNLITH